MKNFSCDIKRSLCRGRVTVGSWITLADPAAAEIMANAGFDWLAIDMEHSAITLDRAQLLIQVIGLSGVAPLVRVESNNANSIKRVMDAGARGVIVPMVNDRDDARHAVEAVRYPPLGHRGVGLARAQRYGMAFKQYKDWVNRDSVVIVQIEDIRAIDNLEEILAVKGVDASIIGPYDLSASLGSPGDFKNKKMRAAVKRYLDVCKDMNKPAGFHVISPYIKDVNEKIREGFSFIGFSLAPLLLGEKIRAELKGLKKY